MQQAPGYVDLLQVLFVFSGNGDGFLFQNKLAQDGVIERQPDLSRFAINSTIKSVPTKKSRRSYWTPS